MKVLTVVGTRPEIIRLSRVIPRLDDAFEHVLVHTGQNYDPSLNQQFFDDLELRSPDHQMAVDTSSLGTVLAGVLVEVERLIAAENPNALLVLGDTNSSIAALMAKRLQVPVYHMEAGNRAFDENVPEEINRRMIDHLSDFNLVYTEHARRNLLAEGIHPRRVVLTGSPMGEVLHHYSQRISASTALSRLSLEPRNYFLVSAHRQENVDSPERLRMLLDCLQAVRSEWGKRVVVSTHPRTRNRLGALAGADVLDGLEFMQPFGFLDYISLQSNAACVLSDSGTISEESAILSFPAVTLRDAIERPEALDSGSISMTGLDQEDAVRNVRLAMARADRVSIPDEYMVRDTSSRVVNLIASTASRHHQWAGIRLG